MKDNSVRALAVVCMTAIGIAAILTSGASMQSAKIPPRKGLNMYFAIEPSGALFRWNGNSWEPAAK